MGVPVDRLGAEHAPDKRALGHIARGFTLIELVVTVAIVAILAALGAPTMRDTVLNQQVRTATFDIYSSLIYARSEAIKRNASINVVQAASGWAAGWTVQLASDNSTLRTQAALSNTSVTGPAAAITYRRDGRLANGAAPSFTLDISGNSNIVKRCVTVNLSGQPNIMVDQNKDGNCNNG